MRHFFLFGFLIISITITQAQPDSAKTTYSTEDSRFSADDVRRFFRYITRADVEEKTLVKVGAWPVGTTDNPVVNYQSISLGLTLETTVEHKITPSFSTYLGANISSTAARSGQFSINPAIPGTGLVPDRVLSLYITPKVGTRYYYGMARKIARGKSANNLSGNYVGAQFAFVSTAKVYARLYDLASKQYNWLNGHIDGLLQGEGTGKLFVCWGFQRRIGSLGYLDVNAGPEINRLLKHEAINAVFQKAPAFQNLTLRVNAIIGLGWHPAKYHD